MENYNFSTRAMLDIAGIYKRGIKYFGINQAVKYQYELENIFEELSKKPEIARDGSTLKNNLKFYRYKGHYVFYQFEKKSEIFIIRVLGKRMNFIEYL
jgi:toxin ParE1/3/4